MKEIKYFVRTTNDRIYEYDLEHEKLIDTEHAPVKSFINQLKYISQWDSVLLEDDLILCKDFKKRIEEVINQYPNKIINFFTQPKEWFLTKESRFFYYTQCVYYPKGVALIVANEMERLWDDKLKLQYGLLYDLLENRALNTLNMTHVQYRPCLVQHLDKSSLIDNIAEGHRRSPYFIDYLDELNISYDQAFSAANKFKLERLLNKYISKTN